MTDYEPTFKILSSLLGALTYGDIQYLTEVFRHQSDDDPPLFPVPIRFEVQYAFLDSGVFATLGINGIKTVIDGKGPTKERALWFLASNLNQYIYELRQTIKIDFVDITEKHNGNAEFSCHE